MPQNLIFFKKYLRTKQGPTALASDLTVTHTSTRHGLCFPIAIEHGREPVDSLQAQAQGHNTMLATQISGPCCIDEALFTFILKPKIF